METHTFFFLIGFSASIYSISCNLQFLHPHIIYQGVIGTVIEYFSEAYTVWPTYLCKLAVLGTKAARSGVAVFNPPCCSQVCRKPCRRLAPCAVKGASCRNHSLNCRSAYRLFKKLQVHKIIIRYRAAFSCAGFKCLQLRFLFWTNSKIQNKMHTLKMLTKNRSNNTDIPHYNDVYNNIYMTSSDYADFLTYRRVS